MLTIANNNILKVSLLSAFKADVSH